MCHISQTRGIGTIRSHQQGPEYEDDGLSSDEADGQEGEASDDENEIEPKSSTPDESNAFTPPARSSSLRFDPNPFPYCCISASHPTREVLLTIDPEDSHTAPSATYRHPFGHVIEPSIPVDLELSRQSSRPTPTPGKRKKIPGPWQGQTSGDFELEADNDIMGIVMLEIHSATDLPRFGNSKLFEPLTHRPLNCRS